MAKVLQVAVSNFIDHMKDREFPACFTENEFADWMVHEEEMKTVPIRRFVCRDCTSSYQSKMIAEGRCFNAIVPLIKIIDKN